MENTTVSQVEAHQEATQQRQVTIGDLFVHKTNHQVAFVLLEVTENNKVHGRRVDAEGKVQDVAFLAAEILFVETEQ